MTITTGPRDPNTPPYTCSYETYCTVYDCPKHYPPGGPRSSNPKFRWAKAHTKRTGHPTHVRKVEEWHYTP